MCRFPSSQFGWIAVLALAAWLGLPAAVRTARAVDAADPWEGEISAFERLDRQTPPPAEPILFVGSSSIRFWDLKKSFPDLPAINRGFGGSTVADVLRNVDRLVLKYKPPVIVFYSGDNDIAGGKTPEQVSADFAALLKRIRAELPQTRVIFLPTKPSNLRWKLVEKMRDSNARIKALAADDPLLIYVDVATPLLGADGKPRAELFRLDGLHLNDEGYELWTSIVKPYLEPKP
jgi:lysophospholipase L1-like esterase